MGIPRLRHHLLPFSESIVLRKDRDSPGDSDDDDDGLRCVHSVVIDGPSLVYNIYSRLLSWFSVSNHCTVDALPTCDEVSRGVMVYLLHLKILGVEIQAIYFDGALPARKHETRLARLESQRRKLEIFCAATKHGFQKRTSPSSARSILPETVLCSRPLSSRCSSVPINPFIVPTVFEDLKCRWSGQNIRTTLGKALPLISLNRDGFPWADITIMVPGEADTYCAHTASLTGSSVLTNDSDLILHNLGESGSVIFLDSVELSKWDSINSLECEIRAAVLYPSQVARRLGITGLLPLAYELKNQPDSGLVELLRRTQDDHEGETYDNFAAEYTSDPCRFQPQPAKDLDTRISELYWQYVMRGEYTDRDNPQVYLPVLQEDHTKRCAWAKGRSYRSIGYSILNLSRPASERYWYTTEFVRRGQRITNDRIPLQDHNSVWAEMESLCARMESLRAGFKRAGSSLREFWKIFALLESYGLSIELTQRDVQKLDEYLELGYMGEQLEWADIHLTAQIQAILYSLRVLKQLLELSSSDDDVSLKLVFALEQLPPLHLMMDSSRQSECADHGARIKLSNILGSTVRSQHLLESHRVSTIRGPQRSITQEANIPPRNLSINMYEILKEQ
ncbi:XPG domain containing-domain-containing protein [Aspergillus carlsbadensis]|nr:XPG domain containing-domain-containing protein [Aspergillus carlsbadensis]